MTDVGVQEYSVIESADQDPLCRYIATMITTEARERAIALLKAENVEAWSEYRDTLSPE